MTSRRDHRLPSARGLHVLLLAALLALSVEPCKAETPVAAPLPQVGDSISSFDAEGLDGVTKHVVFAKDSTTVLLFFLSGCPVCHRMIPEWNRAFERKAKGLQVIGILMDREPPGFFMATPISFPVVRSPGSDFLKGLKVNRVPLTLRVAGGGVVKDVGLGQLDAIRLGEIFRP